MNEYSLAAGATAIEDLPASRSEEVHLLNEIDQALAAETSEAVFSPPPRGLHNGRQPFYTIKHERLEHRVILYLKAEGHSNVEIAQITGFTPVAVSNIVRQPWAQDEVLRIIRSHGEDAVETTLKGAALDSVLKLIDLRESPKAGPEVQRKAANDLLDRLFGKPNQRIEHQNIDVSKVPDAELLKHIPTSSTGAA